MEALHGRFGLEEDELLDVELELLELELLELELEGKLLKELLLEEEDEEGRLLMELLGERLSIELELELVEDDALAGTKALMFAEVELASTGKKTALAIAEVELDAENPAPTEEPVAA